MRKEILEEYIDACELVKETEEDIKYLKKKKQASVLGEGTVNQISNGNKYIGAAGAEDMQDKDWQLHLEEKLLVERKKNAEHVKLKAEEFLNTVPARMQRIIRFKVFQRLTWEAVAVKMGRGATGESVKKEYFRFLNEN
ncbi:RNA polymerase subunit sigma-70 [Diplocloster modestus]|uniref:RNA polymerase subunit sigma-70 n=1 Tax=Diplocloster modestus TaxID=2850322 RepID=A0ABS6KF47_9FIRM|nr:RNA polymerase subunit sigma-70 [Diplocloster modestus]MBU9729152.1 RNA polymerase subunit sigma-70 [Diplocloster modestus]